MAEEAVIIEEPTAEVDIPEDPDSGTEAATIEPSVEDLASELGWKPESDFEGVPEDFVPATEFIRRSKDIQESMRKHLKENRKQMTTFEKAIKEIKAHNKKVQEAQKKQYEQEINALKKQRTEAIEEGDVSLVEEIEKKMSTISESIPEEEPDNYEPDSDAMELYSSWRKNNAWYQSDNELTKYADAQAELPQYVGLPYERKLELITQQVKKIFPDKFPAKQAPKATSVEGARVARSTGKKYSKRDLSPEQRSIGQSFVDAGALTWDKYISDLQQIGEIR